jgi:pimeloyl-ACP methyl ester carboxylesterase
MCASLISRLILLNKRWSLWFLMVEKMKKKLSGQSALRQPGDRGYSLRTLAQSFTLLVLALSAVSASSECVILIHGLARTSSSMEPVATVLMDNGYSVVNVDYPSREKTIEELAPLVVNKGLSDCPAEKPVHFVTHSLGGILVRYYLHDNEIPRLGRVVMLAPPNNGSEVVDNLRDIPGFVQFNGPAGMQLGTDENSVPMSLGPVDFDLGVIAGSETFNPLLSLYLPNPDDGKVSVESTKIEGMNDFIVVPHSHPFIMSAPVVLEQILLFLRSGRFDHATS